MKSSVLLAVIFLLISAKGKAQQTQFESEVISITAGAGLSAGFFNADMRSFQGAFDCGLFQNGSGGGFSVFISAERKLAPFWYASLSADYVDRSGKLALQSGFYGRNLNTNAPQFVETSNEIKAELAYFELHPEIKFTVIPELIRGPLKFCAGFRIYFPLSNSFEQTERIVSPDNAVFIIDGKRLQKRIISSGNIETISGLGTGFSAGIENLMSAGEYWNITQKIQFDHNFSNIVKDAVWKSYSLRFEVGIRYSLTSFYMPSPLEP